MLNMGPQHPSTHGVLRVVLEMDGEIIVDLRPDVGYLHRGIEKIAEHRTYNQVLPLTDRLDYVSAAINNLGWVETVEKALGLEVPERAKTVRVILCELQRIASHLIWLGTHALDIGAMTVLLYCFRERERIMDIFENYCGARLTTSCFRVGGLMRELPEEFEGLVRDFLAYFPARIEEYDGLLSANPIWLKRTKGVGVIGARQAIDIGLSGPALRGSGVARDIRVDEPYANYERFKFIVPVGKKGDVYDRYQVRMEEFRQSISIVRQALDYLPNGPIMADAPQIVPPSKEAVAEDMSALIHQFKLLSKGYKVPAGEIYHAVEAPKGELGFYLVSDGSEMPYRLKIRGPSFVNLQALYQMSKGCLLADMVAIIGSLDICLGEVDR